MKKEITVLQSFCDVCGKEAGGYTVCLRCGKEFCYECKKTETVEYRYAISFSGSGDGLYCINCDAILIKTKADKKHMAYRRLAMLRAEYDGWRADFKDRSNKAENDLKLLNA